MTFKTLIAAVAVALALAPSAHAAGPAPTPARVQQAKWEAYDDAVRTAYAPAPQARTLPPVTTTEDSIPTAGRIALAMMVVFVAAAIFFVRRRDAVRTSSAGGWDM
jgi:hypothetical protein